MIRIFRHYISRIYVVIFLLEMAVFLSAFYLGGLLNHLPEIPASLVPSPGLIFPSLCYMAIMVASTTGMGLYQRAQHGGDAGLLLRVLSSFIMGSVAMGLGFYLLPFLFVGRGVFGYALLVALTLVLITRFVFLRRVDRAELQRRVVVMGAGYNANMIHDFENRTNNPGFKVAGYIQMANETCRILTARTRDPGQPLSALALAEDIEEIVVALDDRRGGLLPVDELLDCKMSGIAVVDLLTFFEREAGLLLIDALYPGWLVFSDGFQYSGLQQIAKRTFDILASVLLLAVAWPVMLLACLAIQLESGWRAPILYRQTRVGRNGVWFQVIKFRSMRTDAEKHGAQWASKNDDRITLVGRFIRKTRIDELPQLFNVFKGDMSFVGPRPERPEFVDRFCETIPYYAERHRVKPGITGWAQLCYPYGSGYQDAIGKLQYDLYYVKNYSLFLDLLIMLQTVEVVLWGKGAR